MRDKNFLKQVKELPHLRFGDKIYNQAVFLDRHIPTLITKKMFRELDRVFDSAYIALHQGVSKAHPKVSSDDNNQFAILGIRFEYLKNSVLWYNSSVDYILQIIYFFFCFYRVEISPSKGIKISSEITNKKSYEKCLRNCSWTKINEIFNKINEINNLQPDQILELTNFYENLNKFYDKCKIIREWANKFKHRGGFVIKGLEDEDYDDYGLSSNNTGNVISTSIFRSEVLEIDDVISELIKSHHIIYEFAISLYNIIDYENIRNSDTKFKDCEFLTFLSKLPSIDHTVKKKSRL